MAFFIDAATKARLQAQLQPPAPEPYSPPDDGGDYAPNVTPWTRADAALPQVDPYSTEALSSVPMPPPQSYYRPSDVAASAGTTEQLIQTVTDPLGFWGVPSNTELLGRAGLSADRLPSAVQSGINMVRPGVFGVSPVNMLRQGAGGVTGALASQGVHAVDQSLPPWAQSVAETGAELAGFGLGYEGAPRLGRVAGRAIGAADQALNPANLRQAAPEAFQYGRGNLTETGGLRPVAVRPDDMIGRRTTIQPGGNIVGSTAGGAGETSGMLTPQPKPRSTREINAATKRLEAIAAKKAAGETLSEADRAFLMDELGRGMGATTAAEREAAAPWNAPAPPPTIEEALGNARLNEGAANLLNRTAPERRAAEMQAAREAFAARSAPDTSAVDAIKARITMTSRARSEAESAWHNAPDAASARTAYERFLEADNAAKAASAEAQTAEFWNQMPERERMSILDRTRAALQVERDPAMRERLLEDEAALRAQPPTPRETIAERARRIAQQPRVPDTETGQQAIRSMLDNPPEVPDFPLQGGGLAGGAELPPGGIPSRVTPEQAFPTAAEKLANVPTWKQKALTAIEDVANIPRTTMASFDLSGSLRQAGFLGPSHWREWKNAMGAQARALVSEDAAKQIMAELDASPLAQYRKGTSLYQAPFEGGQLGQREEQFMSSIASKLPGVKESSRAYVVMLNKYRADVFDNVVSKWPEDARTPKRLDDLAKFVNAATGRGNLPQQLQGMAPAINALFFSPRFMYSIPERHLAAFTRDPLMRKEVVKDLGAFYATGLTLVGATYAAAKAGLLPGVSVATDYHNPDWGKVKIGDTRIDLWGGQQQWARMMARTIDIASRRAQGQPVKPTEGELNTVTQFLRYKFSPIANLEEQVRTGKTAIGQKAPGIPETALRLVAPLFLQDMYDAYTIGGPEAAALTVPSVLGLGVQTYKPSASSGKSPVRAPRIPGYAEGTVVQFSPAARKAAALPDTSAPEPVAVAQSSRPPVLQDDDEEWVQTVTRDAKGKPSGSVWKRRRVTA